MQKPSVTTALIVFAVCILAACGTAPTPNTASAPTAIPPTETKRPTPTPASSRTPLPPPTRRPSQTPTELPTLIQSITSFPTEVDFAQTTLSPSFTTCEGVFGTDRLSPQKNWALCGYMNDFTAMNQDGTLWSLSLDAQFGFEYDGNIRLIHWTADEKFLYFSVTRYAGDGSNPTDPNAEVLFRLDLSNGKVSTILGNPAAAKFDNPMNPYVVSISPTSRRLVYSTLWPPSLQLNLVDLRSGDEHAIDIDHQYDGIGDFVWSNDGQQLVYKLYRSGSENDSYCSYTYAIRLLNLADFSSITFVKNVTVDLCEAYLPEFDIVEVSATQVVLKRQDQTWIYGIKSQGLALQGTVTPSP